MPSRFWRKRPCLPLSMSESDFSGRFPGPVTGLPRRPLSNRASTASWSMRFSLLTIISGAPRSSSLLRRLLRLMTLPVEVVQVGGGEAAAVELHHRAQVGRDDRDDVQYHRLGPVVGLEERRDDLEPLGGLVALLALGGADRLAQLLAFVLEVEVQQQLADRLGAHAPAEVLAVALAQVAELLVLVDELLGLEVLELLEEPVQVLDLAVQLLAVVAHLLDQGLAHLLDLLVESGHSPWRPCSLCCFSMSAMRSSLVLGYSAAFFLDSRSMARIELVPLGLELLDLLVELLLLLGLPVPAGCP